MAELRFPRLWLAAGWLLCQLVIYLSLAPAPPDLDVEQGDKIGHLAAYAGLMLWFSLLYYPFRQRIAIAIVLVLLGIGLEFAQRATGYRSFELADMAADALGVLIGWLLAPPRLPNLLQWLEKHLPRR